MKKYMLKTSMLSVAVAVALGTVGCSSGGGDSSDPVTATASAGTAIDGILVGSTVCIDVNNNNMCDTGEPTDPDGTDSKGKFQIPETTQTGPLLLIGGTDSGTGQAFTGMLKAPAGSTVVTPLTSAVQSLVESGKSAADAEANVKAALGIPSTVDLVNFDPFEEIEGANAEAAQIVLAKQTQLQVLVHTAAVTVAGADGDTNVEDTMSSVFDAIVTNFDGAAGEVELDAAAVATATRTVADEVYADNAAARVATKVVAASTAADAVREADSAQETIANGDPEDAVDNLNNAITLVNTSTELAVAAAVAAATENANDLTEEALAEIERLQDERDRLEAAIAAAEAAAEAAAQQAADDLAAAIAASDKAAYEAALLAQVHAEELAAAQAAAELAAAEAAVAAAQAEADIAEALAAQALAEAQAAAVQAAAEAALAEQERLAAVAAAQAAQDALDMAAAQAAAEAEVAAAQAAIDAAKVDAIVTVAGFYAVQAANDATATRAIFDLNTTLYADVEAKAVIAENAASDAEDAVALAELVDTNTTQAIVHRDEALIQAGIAVTALSDARGIKSAADLAVAAQVAVAAKVARIQVIVTTVTNMNTTVSTALATANSVATQVGDDMDAIEALLAQYPTAQTVAATASVTAGEAEALLNEATTLAATVATAKTNVDAALIAVDETAAQAAEASAIAAQASFTDKVTEAGVKAEAVAAALVDVEAIKTQIDANVAAAIAASQVAAVASSNAAQQSATAATISKQTAQQITNPNASAYVAAVVEAAAAATTAAQAAAEAAGAAAIATTVVDAGNAANAAADAATAAANAATAAATALTSAQNEPAPVAGADNTWFDGKTLHGFWMDKDDGELEVMYEDVTLAGTDGTGLIDATEYIYDGTTWSDVPVGSDDDLILLNGVWEGGATESYAIDTTNSTIMTLSGTEAIRIDSIEDVSGQEINISSEDESISIPVTFSTGAFRYHMSWKNVVATYRLEWEQTDYSTGATYASLEDYMNTNGHFYHDNENNIGVQAQRNADGNLSVDSNGDPIEILTFGETGNLVEVDWDAGTETVVGAWTVVNLPNQTILTVQAVLDANATNYDAYMEYGEISATLYDATDDSVDNATVHMVEFENAMVDFEPDSGDDDVMMNDIALADIKTAVEAFSFPTAIDVEAYFESGAKYFVNENSLMGERTFYDANSTYTGIVNGNAESGTYSVTNNVITLIRDADGSTYEFTYVSPTEFGNGETFSLSINGNTAFETYNYSSDADRAAGMVAATAFMKDFFTGTQKFYLNENQGTGDRTFSAATGTTVPYTGTYTGNVDGSPVDGSYTVFGDTLRLDRTGGAILVFEHTGATTDLSVNTFSLSINDGTPFVTTNYASETARDAALAATTWSADLGSITVEDFTNNITHTVTDPTGTWWFVDDASNFEEITIAGSSTTGTVSFTETEGGSVVETGLIYYTVDTVAPYGSVVGLKENEADTTYMEYIKFFESLNQAALQSAYSHITWSAGATAVKNAGITAVDSFDAWDGDFGTVSYTNFTDLITGMTTGNSSMDDDAFIIGNGQDAIVFPSGSTTGGGDVVVEGSGETAGTFEIKDVDGVSTLVVYITHQDFTDDDHIVFQYTDIGNGTAMYRGEIYDRWSDILLNTIAKDDVLNFLAP